MQDQLIALNKEDADALPSIIQGIVPIFQNDVKVLIDLVATHLLVAPNFLCKFFVELENLNYAFLVSTPSVLK